MVLLQTMYSTTDDEASSRKINLFLREASLCILLHVLEIVLELLPKCLRFCQRIFHLWRVSTFTEPGHTRQQAEGYRKSLLPLHSRLMMSAGSACSVWYCFSLLGAYSSVAAEPQDPGATAVDWCTVTWASSSLSIRRSFVEGDA